jgi:hypothetical protein
MMAPAASRIRERSVRENRAGTRTDQERVWSAGSFLLIKYIRRDVRQDRLLDQPRDEN